ncbi:MAG: hypothetical protein K6G92_14125, partial [Bacteroidaceae bacterium]|nr:hypothetical protein [Bacteroidaceae bacterium]
PTFIIMQFLDCKITLSFSNQKIKDRSETLINKGIYEVKLKFIASLIFRLLNVPFCCVIVHFVRYSGMIIESMRPPSPYPFKHYMGFMLPITLEVEFSAVSECKRFLI